MKQLLIALVVVGAMVALLGTYGTTMEVVNERVNTVEVEVTPDWASDEDAVKAAQDVIRKKEMQAEIAVLEAEIASSTARLTTLEKKLETYWRDVGNIKALIRQTFPEEPEMAVLVAQRESAGNFGMGQSTLRYPKDRPDWGVSAGQQEQSFCFFQIHAPAHDKTAERLGLMDYKTNVESCVKMARVIYDDAGGFYPWTEYHKIIAMR